MRELRTCGSVGGPDGQPSALPGKVLSATLAVAHAHPTINPHWLSSRQSFPPTIHRWFERPLRPICCGLRPSRLGWISAIPYVSMTPSTVGVAKKARGQS